MSNQRLPSLTALRAFECAARHASMSRAAEELFVSHGAVSRQVAALEAEIGLQLFIREKRPLSLTPAGAALAGSLTAAFGSIREGLARAGSVAQGAPLVVSCTGTLMLRWLIPRLPRFRKVCPEVEVRLAADYKPVDFARDRVDLAIRLIGRRAPAGVASERLFSQRFGPVCAAKLQRRRAIRRPADLAGHRLLESETRPPSWAGWLKAQGLDPKGFEIAETYEHFYFMLQAADAGLGVALGTAPIVDGDLKSGRLIAPLGLIPSGYSYALLRPKGTASRPEVAAFRDWLLAEAKAALSA